MKNILFPQAFKLVGWTLFIPSIVVAILCYFDILALNGIAATIINDIMIIGIAVGALFIVCSKEPHEDEMIRSIRLASLLNALYAYIILLIPNTLLLNGIAYMRFTIVNTVLLPIIYVILFRLEIQRHNKMIEDEEQD